MLLKDWIRRRRLDGAFIKIAVISIATSQALTVSLEAKADTVPAPTSNEPIHITSIKESDFGKYFRDPHFRVDGKTHQLTGSGLTTPGCARHIRMQLDPPSAELGTTKWILKVEKFDFSNETADAACPGDGIKACLRENCTPMSEISGMRGIMSTELPKTGDKDTDNFEIKVGIDDPTKEATDPRRFQVNSLPGMFGGPLKYESEELKQARADDDTAAKDAATAVKDFVANCIKTAKGDSDAKAELESQLADMGAEMPQDVLDAYYKSLLEKLQTKASSAIEPEEITEYINAAKALTDENPKLKAKVGEFYALAFTLKMERIRTLDGQKKLAREVFDFYKDGHRDWKVKAVQMLNSIAKKALEMSAEDEGLTAAGVKIRRLETNNVARDLARKVDPGNQELETAYARGLAALALATNRDYYFGKSEDLGKGNLGDALGAAYDRLAGLPNANADTTAFRTALGNALAARPIPNDNYVMGPNGPMQNPWDPNQYYMGNFFTQRYAQQSIKDQFDSYNKTRALNVNPMAGVNMPGGGPANGAVVPNTNDITTLLSPDLKRAL
jgi:hypothetical protein